MPEGDLSRSRVLSWECAILSSRGVSKRNIEQAGSDERRDREPPHYQTVVKVYFESAIEGYIFTLKMVDFIYYFSGLSTIM